LRGERRRRKTRRNHQVRRGRCVRRVARGVEQVGLVGRRNWDAKRKGKVQKGVGGQEYVGVLLRGSGRRVGRRQSHCQCMHSSYHARIQCSESSSLA